MSPPQVTSLAPCPCLIHYYKLNQLEVNDLLVLMSRQLVENEELLAPRGSQSFVLD